MPTFDWYAVSDPGDNPDGNEDTCVIDGNAGVFVVADGVGGRPGGARASRVTAETFVDLIRSTPAAHRLDEKTLQDAVSRVHETVLGIGEADEELRGLASTLSAVVIADGRARLVHVGDSRVYRVHDGAIQQLTRDHTVAADVERAGKPKVAPQFQNMLSRAIGSGEHVDPDVSDMTLEMGDWLLLVTDGVAKVLATDELLQVVSKASGGSAKTICNSILRAVLERKPADNVTVAAVGVSA